MMNKIKDIIYDFNDILVILLIIIITAGILFWRIQTIMAYPEYLAKSQQPAKPIEMDISGVTGLKTGEADTNLNADPDKVEANWDDITSEGAIEDANESEVGDGTKPADQPDTPVTATDNPDNVVNATGSNGGKNQDGVYITFTEVKFTVPAGATGTRVGNLLAEAELVESREAFVGALIKAKKENRIQVGTFTIPQGSTVEDIVDIVTK